jgi:GMP synthase-like glutamine amidotransferase
MRIHWLQHADFEDLGCIAPALAARGDTVTCTRLWAGETPPANADGFDALIVIGGPMNIYEYDLHPWLKPEKALIRATIDAGKRVLGICLGSQLIADVLGGPVTRNAHTEIGWFPVELNDAGRRSRFFAGFPDRFTVFHWHGDTFAIPPRAANLMTSAGCVHQALAYDDRVVGIQFHLEVTAANAREWFRHEQPVPATYVQAAGEILADLDAFAGNNRLMRQLLANWLG